MAGTTELPPTPMFPTAAQGRSRPYDIYSLGQVNYTTDPGDLGVSVRHHGADGGVIQSVLTLVNFSVITGNTTGISFGGTKVYDFPTGRILVLGCTAYFDIITFGADIASGGSGDYSLGTTITADGTLATTEVDLLPSSAMLDPFVTRTGRSNVGTALAAAAQFDGTTTAIDMNLNAIVDDADVSDGAANDPVLFTGKIYVTWMNLGKYTTA